MVFRCNRFGWRTCLPLAFILVSFTAIAAKSPTVVMRYDPDKPNRKSSIIWLAYVVARAAFHEGHHLPIPTSGEIVPSFDEEVDARTTAVQTYRTLKAKDPALKDTYWDTLSEVERKGFMPAYVWTFLRRKDWPLSRRPAGIAAFNDWKQHALPKHTPQTYSWLEGGKP